jgi:D-sedoheptulose 7-phosphate isomerase
VSIKAALKQSLSHAKECLNQLYDDEKCIADIEKAIDACVTSYKTNHKVLICGNGGSSCDAAHFAEELVGRFRKNRRALPALAFSEPGAITCIANDFGYDHVFARHVEAFGQSGDIWIGLTTSGNSENIIQAYEMAKQQGLKTIVFLGKDGGKLKGKADIDIHVAGETSDRIQELHMLILHMMVEGIERCLFPDLYESTAQ